MPNKSLFEQLTDAINENDSLTESTRKHLMLMAITEVYNNTQCLPEIKKNIDILERKSIVIQAQKHPKIATMFIISGLIFIMMLFTIWTSTGIDEALLSLLGL